MSGNINCQCSSLSTLVPSSPRNLSTQISTNAISTGTNINCQISWNVPISNNNTTGYTVTISPGNLSITTIPTVRTYTFSGLSSVTQYTFRVIARNIAGSSVPAKIIVTTPAVYTILQRFTASGTFTMPIANPKLTSSTPIDLFIVAGGGGGAKLSLPLPGYAQNDGDTTYCGGGGAGGVLQVSTTLVPGDNYTVNVGNGGNINTSGSSSSFDSYSAIGGGNGATIYGTGGNGGSGGGGGGEHGVGGLGTPGQGNRGGNNGGGGGGAGGVGLTYNPLRPNGGIGILYRGTYYGGGGGGDNGVSLKGFGGQGGGGNAKYEAGGSPNTGGGGGAGGAGGSGIVIVSAVI